MSPGFKDRLLKAKQEAQSNRDSRDSEWYTVREMISSVLTESAKLIGDCDGLKAIESNDNCCHLRCGEDLLEFCLDRSTQKIVMTSTRRPSTRREYDLNKISARMVESVVEEFVRDIYS